MVWTTYPNKKQEVAFVSLIQADDFTADIVIVKSVKTSADEQTHYSEQDINWPMLDGTMTSEVVKDVNLCVINQAFYAFYGKGKGSYQARRCSTKNIIPIAALRSMRKREREKEKGCLMKI